MKQLTKFSAVRSFLTLLCLVVFQAALIAQDAQPGSSSTTTVRRCHIYFIVGGIT